ncbi:MAG: TolC family protein [Bacteroidota bacterium]
MGWINNVIAPYGNLRISYDIYSAGVRKRSVEVARINEEVARVEIQEMEHALTNELFNLYDYHEVRIELLNVAIENMAAAELNLSISEEKYKTGVINSFNYRDVQLIYLNAAIQHLQAVYGLINSKTQLTRNTGGFLGTSSQ